MKSMGHFLHMVFYYKRPDFALERTGRASESFFLNTGVGLTTQSIIGDIAEAHLFISIVRATKQTKNKHSKQ